MFSRLTAALIALCVVCPAVAAQDSTKKASRAKLHVDLGYVNTSGNTTVTTLSLEDELTVLMGRNKVAQTFATVYGTSNDTVNTSLWRAGLRDDFALNKRIGVFGLVAYERNRFAGLDRRLEEGVGLSATVWEAPRNHLELALGGSLVQERSTLGVKKDFPAAHASMLYKYTISKAASVGQKAEYLPNLEDSDDFRFNSETSLVAPLSTHIALKLTYVIRFANQPPAEFEKTDRLLTTGIQITF